MLGYFQMGNLSGAMTPNIKVDMFSRILDTNVRGTMLCVRAASKAMAAQEPLSYESRRSGMRSLGRGSIVNLGSVNWHVAAPGMMPYTASKHAIAGITKTAGMSSFVSFSWLLHPSLILSLIRSHTRFSSLSPTSH